MAGTLEIPSIGEKNTTADPKLKTGLETFNNLLDSSNKVTDTGLASPNNSAYRSLLTAQSIFRSEQAAGTYAIGIGNSGNNVASGVNLIVGSVGGIPSIYFSSSDLEVAGKTQKLRIRAQAAVNATKPTIKFTVGLYPITVAGGVNELKITLGTVVSGSIVEINEPAASTVTQVVNSDFTIPVNGAYVLGVVTSGTLTAGSTLELAAQLQTRSV